MSMQLDNPASKGEIVIYQTKDKNVCLEVQLERETIWLTQADVARLFATDRSVITKHISNIFKSRELNEKSNVQKMHNALIDANQQPVIYRSLLVNL